MDFGLLLRAFGETDEDRAHSIIQVLSLIDSRRVVAAWSYIHHRAVFKVAEEDRGKIVHSGLRGKGQPSPLLR